MQTLYNLIASSEDWLMRQVLRYAKERDYVKYTSTLAEAWRISIAGLSKAILETLQTSDQPPELGPDEDYTKDPITAFGILQAQRHRARGIRLDMFLGLMKYYRQSYIDLVREANFEPDYEEHCRLFIERCFDRLEIGFCVEWAESSESKLLAELQTTNRSMTNEKNKYLTIFESIHAPVILLDRENRVDNVNHAAAKLFERVGVLGSRYYAEQTAEQTLPWLSKELAAFAVGGSLELSLEHDLETAIGVRHFQIRLKRMLDVSEKFSGTVVILDDVTEQAQSEEALRCALEESQQRRAEVSALLDGSRAILKYRDFEEVARSLFDSCKELIGATAGYVALLTPDGMGNEVLLLDSGGLECIAGSSLPMPIRGLREEAYRTGKAVYCNDFANSDWVELLPQGHMGLTNVLFAPLVIEGKTVGLLGVANKPGEFTDTDARMATAFGELGAIALHNSRTLESLESSEERFRSVVQTAGDAVITIDSQGTITFWNHAAEVIFGYSAGETVGRPLAFVMPEQFREAHKEGMLRVGRTGESKIIGKTVEVVGLRKDGSEFPVELSLARWQTCEDTFFTGIIRDITERKRSEGELRQERDRAQRYLDIAGVMLVALNEHGEITLVNRRGCQILGYEEEVLIGRNWFDTCLPIHIREEVKSVFDQLMTGEIEPVEYHENPVLTSSGEERAIAWHNIVLKDDVGNIIGTLSSGEDITERKRAEEQIKASLREKETLLMEVHHRVKNNMQVIVSMLGLQSEYIKDKEALEVFKESQARIRSMALVHEKLYQSPDLARVDFAKYVQSLAMDLVKIHNVDPDAVRLKVDMQGVFWSIEAAVPCGLLLNELISNCLKHAFPDDREGEVCIEMRSEGDKVILAVSDDGIGFPEELDFRSAESLGLQLVVLLAGQLGGEIELERGGGTTFRIVFGEGW